MFLKRAKLNYDKIKIKLLKVPFYIALGVMAKYIYTFDFSPGDLFDISINLVPLPAIIASILMGPFWGAFIGGAIDIMGHFLHPLGDYIPLITVIAVLRGFLPGFFIHQFKIDKITFLNLFIVIGITQLISQVVLMSYTLHLYQIVESNLQEILFIRFFVQIFAVPLFSGLSYIIIKQKYMRDELEEREEQFRTLVSNIPDAIFRCKLDEDWTMIFMSDYIKEITKFPAADFIKNQVRSYNSIIHEEDRLRVVNIKNKHLSRKEAYFLNYRIVDAGGKKRYIQEKGEGIFSSKGKLKYIDGVISDITEIIKKEEQLKNTKKDLIIGRERTRIARELHDSISQSLNGINYSVHTLKKMINEVADEKDYLTILDHLEETTEESLQELKNMIVSLKPTRLEKNGLHRALITQCESFTERTHIKLTHDIDQVDMMTPEQELAIFRILQEGLTNIQKHSGADQVRIFFKKFTGKAFLTIADNGTGFAKEEYNGYGLENMKTRAFQNHGKFEIESSQGMGTVIRVAFEIMDS